MLKIKELKKETLTNVKTTIKLKNAESIDNDINGAAEYTRSVTTSMNQVLKTLEYTITGQQTEKI